MKALIVYESMFGNTKAVAAAIAAGLDATFEVRLIEVTEMPPVLDADLLVVGAPTHAFGLSRPATRQDASGKGPVSAEAAAVGLREYLDGSPTLSGVRVAAFDTKINKPYLTGSAARKALRQLHRLGGRVMLPAESFRVDGTTGPLVDGELARARRWAQSLAATALSERPMV
jgi:hypothetical protein